MKARKFTRETITQLGQKETAFPPFKVGDTINVALRIKEGEKERIQNFEGDVICIRNNGGPSSFTVRKISASSIAVERVFPYSSPKIESIKFIRRGKVRRAKLFYLRKRVGKAARVEEQVISREQRENQRSVANAANKEVSL